MVRSAPPTSPGAAAAGRRTTVKLTSENRRVRSTECIGAIAIPAQQRLDVSRLFLDFQPHLHHSTLHEQEERIDLLDFSLEEKSGLREHRLTGEEGRMKPFPSFADPIMMLKTRTQNGHQGPGAE